jgi:hypothetical protein
MAKLAEYKFENYEGFESAKSRLCDELGSTNYRESIRYEGSNPYWITIYDDCVMNYNNFRQFILCKKATVKLFVLGVLTLFLVACESKVKEEPFRSIISFSINLNPTGKGYKPLTMYCDNVCPFIDYEQITYVRYGDEEELRNNEYNEVKDTIYVHFNEANNMKYNDKLCKTYTYYEKKSDGWYTLIVCDSVPITLNFSNNKKKVKYNTVSYTESKKAPTWNDEYLETDKSDSGTFWDFGIYDISKISQSIINEVPNDYSIVHIVYGDLNEDKIDDVVLVLENAYNYNTKLQVLFGHDNSTFSQYKLFDFDIRLRGCVDNAISIKNGILEQTAAKWGCGKHGSHWTYTDYFKYSVSDNKIYLIENYLLYQTDYNQGGFIYDEIENYTTYVKKISIEDFYTSK